MFVLIQIVKRTPRYHFIELAIQQIVEKPTMDPNITQTVKRTTRITQSPLKIPNEHYKEFVQRLLHKQHIVLPDTIDILEMTKDQ